MADTKKTIKKPAADKKVAKPAAKAALKVSKTAKPVVKKAEVKQSLPIHAAKGKVSKPVVKESTEKQASLKVSVFGVDGASKGNITLPTDVFGAKPNKALIAQAIRVYLANQRQGNASTKTRSEVKGSTKKIYRQKGTGRARHGAAKAPIFVGGGMAHGPRPHSFSMDFPKKMRRQALISALSEKAQAGFIKVVDGEFSGKTKEVAKLISKMELGKKGKAEKVLFVVNQNENAYRGAHNISGLEISRVETLSTYGVVVNRNVVFLKSAVEELSKRLAKN